MLLRIGSWGTATTPGGCAATLPFRGTMTLPSVFLVHSHSTLSTSLHGDHSPILHAPFPSFVDLQLCLHTPHHDGSADRGKAPLGEGDNCTPVAYKAAHACLKARTP